MDMRYRCRECESIIHDNYLDTNIITGEAFCPVCSAPIDIYEDGETENYNKFKDILADNISVPNLVNFDDENDDALVIVLHETVKELRTEKRCPHCDAPLYCSDLPQYDYVCIECEENFDECEVR
jgi:DNA-directed RNA polymerase subunit RPC12/RpoP